MVKENRFKLVLVLGFLSAFAPLSIDMYLSAFPTMQHYFATDEGTIALTLASFFIGFSFGQAFYGPISDKYGRKLPLYIGLGLFVVASIGCALSTSAEMLIFFRLLQALGACAGGVISRAVVRDLYDPKEAVKFYSYLMLVSSLAPMLAPILGSFVLSALGWKAIFFILAALGVVSLFSVAFALPPLPKPKMSGELTFSSVMREYYHLLLHKHFIVYTLIGSFAMAGMFAYITASSFIFMDIFGLSSDGYALLFGFNAVVFIIGAQVNAKIIDRFDSVSIMKYSLLLLATSAISLVVMVLAGVVDIYLVSMALLSYMFSLGFIIPNSTAMAMAPFSTNAGSASALLGTLQFSLAAASSIALGFVMLDRLQAMSIVMAICASAALFMMIYLKNLRESIEIE